MDVLTKLAAQHNQQRTTQSIADDRYEIRWEKSAATASAQSRRGIYLASHRRRCRSGPAAGRRADRARAPARILGLPASDADEEQFVGVLRAAAADDPTLRIVHVAALDSDTAPSMRSLLRMQHRVLGGTRRLFRAVAAAELRTPIWVVTRGAQRVTDADTVSPDQSCLWGFGRAASLELPQVWGGLADLAAGTADEWSQFVNHVLAAPRGGRSSRAA